LCGKQAPLKGKRDVLIELKMQNEKCKSWFNAKGILDVFVNDFSFHFERNEGSAEGKGFKRKTDVLSNQHL